VTRRPGELVRVFSKQLHLSINVKRDNPKTIPVRPQRMRRLAPRSCRGAPRARRASPLSSGLGFDAATASAPAGESASTSERVSRHPWAWLLARVFAVDVTVCPQCGGRMRLVKLATTREEITKALAHAGLGPRPPPRARPTMLGQLELPLSRRLNGHDQQGRRRARNSRAGAISPWRRRARGSRPHDEATIDHPRSPTSLAVGCRSVRAPQSPAR